MTVSVDIIGGRIGGPRGAWPLQSFKALRRNSIFEIQVLPQLSPPMCNTVCITDYPSPTGQQFSKNSLDKEKVWITVHAALHDEYQE